MIEPISIVYKTIRFFVGWEGSRAEFGREQNQFLIFHLEGENIIPDMVLRNFLIKGHICLIILPFPDRFQYIALKKIIQICLDNNHSLSGPE